MQIHVIPLIILIAYFVITQILATVVLRKKMGAEHYLVAGRALPTLIVLVIVLGDWLGGGSVIGVAQRGYNDGVVGWIYPISIGIALLVFAFTMAARYRRVGAVTVPEVVGKVFDNKTRVLAALMIALAYYILFVTTIVAGGALLAPLLGVDKWLADLISVAIFLAIVVTGGLTSIALVNIVQCVVIYVGMIIGLVYSLAFIGGSVPAGFSKLLTDLPPSFWSLGATNPITWGGELISVVFTCFAAQAAVTAVFAAKDVKAAVRGNLYTAILIMPIGIVFVMIGMCARIYFGDDLPYGLSASPAMFLALNPVVAGIGLCGAWAAIVSTGPLVMLAVVQIVMQDFYKPYINHNAPDKKVLLYSRLITIAFGVLAFFLAITMYKLLETVFWAFTIRAGIGVILLIGVYMGTKRISEKGAFWGLIAGLVALIGWTVAGSPWGIHVVVPTIVVVFAASLIISKFMKRKAELLPEIKEALHPGSKAT